MALGAAVASLVLGACSSPAPASTAPTTPSTTASTATITDPSTLHVVGLGDGYMVALNRDGLSFLHLFGKQLETRLRRDVSVATYTPGEGTTADATAAIRTDVEMRKTLAKADIIVIGVGSNDADPFAHHPAGTCAPSQPRAACLAAYAPDLTANQEALFTALAEVTKGRNPQLIVTSVDNPFIGSPDAPSPTFGRDFYAQIAEAQTEAIFTVARKHNAKTIDYLHAFGGTDGLGDPAKFLAKDHATPGDLGIQTIADLLTQQIRTP